MSQVVKGFTIESRVPGYPKSVQFSPNYYKEYECAQADAGYLDQQASPSPVYGNRRRQHRVIRVTTSSLGLLPAPRYVPKPLTG